MEPLLPAAAVALLIFLASLISVETALAVSIIEIGAGVLAGNVFGIHGAPWIDFLAQFGGILLTFLAGTELGRLLMASTFITDMGTALALSVLFARPVPATALFLAMSAVLVVLAPRLLPPLFERYGRRVIEPEIKLLFFLLLGLMFLAQAGQSHAVLPVFILGLVLAPMFQQHVELRRKLRIVSFAMITPFFFLKGGMSVSLRALQPQLGMLAVLLGIKLAAKAVGVLPLARRHIPGGAMFTTLLMSTGLTFGTISATYGLEHGYITPDQFSLLVTVVILSAVVPTFIAQRWFAPRLSPEEQEEVLSRAEESP